MGKITIGIEITEEEIENLLISAFEGGIGYWARIIGYVMPPGVLKPEYAYATLPLMEGCAVILQDREDDKSPKLTLDREAIMKGFKIMAKDNPRHFGDFLSDNADATTGDVFVQCCLLGKIVYG